MIRTSLAGIITSAVFLTACEDMFSLTPMEELASFEVQTSGPEADLALQTLAASHSLKVNREASVARVGAGRCLLTVEGVGGGRAEKRVKVTLGAARGSPCDAKMWALFNELRKDLRTNSAA